MLKSCRVETRKFAGSKQAVNLQPWADTVKASTKVHKRKSLTHSDDLCDSINQLKKGKYFFQLFLIAKTNTSKKRAKLMNFHFVAIYPRGSWQSEKSEQKTCDSAIKLSTQSFPRFRMKLVMWLVIEIEIIKLFVFEIIKLFVFLIITCHKLKRRHNECN